jgi:sugar phosphate isomerase/epimerase
MTKFSYQLYSSRNHGPLPDTLKMLAETGYAQVEGYGALYADAVSLSILERGLGATGLEMPTGHFSLEMTRDSPARALEIAKSLGVKGVIVPYLTPDQRPTDAKGWVGFGAALVEIAKPFRDAGLWFGYHNHDFEFVPVEGKRPLDLILTGNDLCLEFDVAWSVRGRADPMAVISQYGDRLKAAHLKDIAPAGENAHEDGWADLGHGTMDWQSLMAALRDAGCEYFVMEHDKPSDDRRFASRALASAQSY